MTLSPAPWTALADPKALTAKTGSVDRLMSIVESTLQSSYHFRLLPPLNPNFRFAKAEIITPLKGEFTMFFS
jgi:hypothetical protein